MEKSTLRQSILDDFATLSADEKHNMSVALAGLVLSEIKSDDVSLMAFLSMPDELDTEPLIRGALDRGIKVYSPKSLRKSRRLIPKRLHSMDSVKSGAYGIREPDGDESIDPGQLDVVIVPAVAFDRNGYRLGRGGGYYDRFLELLFPEALTCGVIFSKYLLDSVPIEAHDRSVQLVATEKEIVTVKKSKSKTKSKNF